MVYATLRHSSDIHAHCPGCCFSLSKSSTNHIGCITCIIQLTKNFLSYQVRLLTELSKLDCRVANVLKYNVDVVPDGRIAPVLIAVYGDVLNFCKAALGLILDSNGDVRGGLKSLWLSLYGPYQRYFGGIQDSFNFHMDDLEAKIRIRDRRIAQKSEKHLDFLVGCIGTQSTVSGPQDNATFQEKQALWAVSVGNSGTESASHLFLNMLKVCRLKSRSYH